MKRIFPCTILALIFLLPQGSWARSTDQIANASVSFPPEQIGHAEKRVSSSKERRAKQRKAKANRKRYRRTRFVQLNDAPGLKVRNPERAWGSDFVIEHLQTITANYQQSFPEAMPVWVHDISKRRGGKFRPHLSHRDGKDVDIRLVLKKETDKYMQATPRTLHAERNWFVLKSLIDTGDIDVVFLDRRLQRVLYRFARQQGYTHEELRRIFEFAGGQSDAIVKHWKGHADHLHVRFAKKSWEKPEYTVAAVDRCVGHTYQ